jgi:predicted nucleic acid-binding protein
VSRVVVSDTGPLRYLVLIRQVDVLPELFGSISIPTAVAVELCHPKSPAALRAWAADPPSWLAAYPDPADPEPALRRLDPGERAAIALAGALGAGLLLTDDRAGAAAARALGMRVTGTLGVLANAASEGLVELGAAFAALRATSFYAPPAILDALLAEDRARRGESERGA